MGGRDSVVFSLCVDDWEDGIRSDVMGVIDRKYITESSVFFFFFFESIYIPGRQTRGPDRS